MSNLNEAIKGNVLTIDDIGSLTGEAGKPADTLKKVVAHRCLLSLSA